MARKLVFLLTICIIALNCRQQFDPKNSKDTIAIVGSFYVTKNDLENEIRIVEEKVEDPTILSEIYDSLIEETLILNEFFKNKSNGKINPLGEYSDGKRRKEIISMLLEENVYSKIEISAKEVEDYYNANKDKFKKGDGVLLRQIIVSGSRLKEEAYSLLQRNYSFEEVARLYSISPEKGNLQFFEISEIPEYLQAEIAVLKEGKISKPIEISEDTYQIILLEKRTKDYILPIDMVRQIIRLKLSDEKGEQMKRDFINSLKKKYNTILFTDRLWFKYVKER